MMTRELKFSEKMDTRIHHVDRITNLPADLIGNILSFLPTKEAVATSVLSPKWRWSWTFITHLDFTDKCASLDEESEDRIELLKASFISYVYRVVFYRKPTPLNYFGVTCRQEYCASHLRAWLSAVLPVGVKEIDLSIHLLEGGRHLLPSDVFSCKSLVKLKLELGRYYKIDVPAVVCLPSLEVLTLDGVGFCDDDSLKRLLVGCPALEKFLSNCCWHTPGVLPLELFSLRNLAKLILGYDFVINPPTHVALPCLEYLYLNGVNFPDNDSVKRFLLGCPSLRELYMMRSDAEPTVLHIDVPMLSDLTICLRSEGVLHSKVVLDTPSLQYLKVDALATESLEITYSSHLVEAHICSTHPGAQFHVASNLIMAISKVQTLYLSGYILEVIAKHSCRLPKFHNMSTLKFGVGNKAGWALLPDLLENAPVLETLVFLDELKGRSYSADQTSTCLAPPKLRFSLFSRFNPIEEVFKYLNENRGLLKDLTIQYPRSWETVVMRMSLKELEAKTSFHNQ